MGMSPRERMNAVLSGEPTDALPVVIPYLDIFLRDHWREVTDLPWWAPWDGDIETHLRIARDLQRAVGVDWVPVYGGHSRAWRERHRIELRSGEPFLVDTESDAAHRLTEPPVGGEQHLVRTASVHTVEQAKNAVAVTPAERMLANGSFDYARAAIREFGDELFVVGSVSTPFWGLYFHFGFNQLMMNLVEHPELVEPLLEDITLHHIEVLRAYAEVGFHGIWIEDCYASSDLISLPQFRRFAAPYAERLVAETNRLGMKSIYYFCGEVADRLEDLVRMEPHAIALEESKKGFEIDIAQVDAVVGNRSCLFGNYDAIRLLETGSPEAIAAEHARQIGVGRRHGRFVTSLGSPVTPRTPAARTREWVELARALSDV